MFTSSKCIADLGMVPCIQHSRFLDVCFGHVCNRMPIPCTATGYRLLQMICCLLTIWVISFTEQRKLSKQGCAAGTAQCKPPAFKSSACQLAFFGTILIYTGSDYTSFICQVTIMQNRHLEKTVRQWHQHTVNSALPLIFK